MKCRLNGRIISWYGARFKAGDHSHCDGTMYEATRIETKTGWQDREWYPCTNG